ncbi:palmitoyltransferase ZDHHC23 isoform X2 [Cimex lectularius]|uniref:Palmitoyltransferase n=1 Tax=Cimex lectularius TaxID=79782 RepID=A0A8I6RN08_CIMLE|nr:palmitoyltransferase ZDHHC23 isoform X2 [Cimex lectularius]
MISSPRTWFSFQKSPRLISCQRVPSDLLMKVMIKSNDRLRIPWKGGARKFNKDAILPIFVLPLSLLWAAQGWWMSVLIFPFMPLFLLYAHLLYMELYPQTYFFYVWNIASTLVTCCVFEGVGVSLLEIRTDENIIFLILTIAVFFCIFKVRRLEKLSVVVNDVEDGDCLVNKVCSDCNIHIPLRAYHCHICQACILKKNQHCAWLNCCIGQSNHFWYIMFLVSNLSQLLLCSNLILTTACHPFKVFGSPIMLPDDCSDVYFDSQYATCFVTAIYCLEVAIFIGAVLVHESWLISLGITGQEYRNRSKRSGCYGLFMPRPFSKGFIRNWFMFWRGAYMAHSSYKI